MISAGKSDIGLVRKVNEDSMLCLNLNDEFQLDRKVSMFIVADGMGGHNAGEVASSMAVQEILSYVKEKITSRQINWNDEESIFDVVRNSILSANDKIYKKAILNSECLGMGTTLSMALVLDNTIYIGHIGDSRVYLVDANGVVKLTEDHSLVAELVKNGTIKPEEANNHPQRNIITRALGTEFTTEVDTVRAEVKHEGYIVLCTDGLSNLITEDEIRKCILRAPSIDTACNELIETAKDRGGHDNITVIIIKMDKDGDCNGR